MSRRGKLTREQLNDLSEQIDRGNYVKRDTLRDLAYTARQFELERRCLAKLACDTPQFSNPFDVIAVQQLRDDVLRATPSPESNDR